MKKLFAGIACLVVIVSGTFLFLFRNHLVYIPGTKAIRLQEPRFAFSLDSGFSIIDQNGNRMLFMDKNLRIKWMRTNSAMLGTIVGAAQKPGSSDLFCVDTITIGGNQFQRLMRIDAQTGAPQETLRQFKVSDSERFIDYSLELEGDFLYFLQKDKSGITYLMRRNLASGEEKSLFRTKWGIESARLAIVGSSVYILAEGQLFLYKAGILQTIPEIEGKMPHIDALCRWQDSLVLADGTTGTLYNYPENNLPVKLTEASSLLNAVDPKPEKTSPTTLEFLDKHLALSYEEGGTYPASVSALSASSGKLVVIDGMNARIAFSAGATPELVVQGAGLDGKISGLVNLAWIMLAALVIALASLVFLGLFSLYAYRNNILTFLLALLPAVLLVLLVLILVFYNTERNRLLAQQKALEGQLVTIAGSAAKLTDGTLLAKTTAKLFGKDFSNLAYKGILSKIDYKDASNVLVAICAPYKTYPAVIADNLNYYREGQPVRFVSSREYASLLKLEAPVSAVRLGNAVKIQAMSPVSDGNGGFAGFASASLTVASLDAGSLFRYVLRMYGLYLVLAAAGFLAIASGIRLLGTRVQEPAHIRKEEDGESATVEPGQEQSPVLDDSDFDIPVIPDTGFRESYSSSNVFDLAELPPLAGVGQLRTGAGEAPIAKENEDTTRTAKTPLKPAQSLFARASKVQTHGAHEEAASASKIASPGRDPVQPAGQADAGQNTHTALELHVDAVNALKSGNYSLAVSLLERVTRLTPGDAKALNNLGIAYKRSGNTAKAIQCFEKALSIRPGDPSLAKNLEILKKAQS